MGRFTTWYNTALGLGVKESRMSYLGKSCGCALGMLASGKLASCDEAYGRYISEVFSVGSLDAWFAQELGISPEDASRISYRHVWHEISALQAAQWLDERYPNQDDDGPGHPEPKREEVAA